MLLKNEDGILPLKPGARVAVIGDFAKTPRYQGAGSSHIEPTKLECGLDALRAEGVNVIGFAPGFRRSGGESRRLPGAQVIGPVGKSGLLLLGLDGHEEGIVLKPVALGLAEGLVGRSGGRQQMLRRLAKDDGPLLVERAIIDAFCGLRGWKLVLRQQTICCQQPVINEVGVACKGREALVGAVPVACGADG